MNTFTRLFNHLTGRATKRLIADIHNQISAQKTAQSLTTEAMDITLKRITQNERLLQKLQLSATDDINALWTRLNQEVNDRATADTNEATNRRAHDANDKAEWGQTAHGIEGRISRAISRIHDLEAATHVHSQRPEHVSQRAAAQRSKAALKADLQAAASQPEPTETETAECASLKPQNTPTKGFIPDTPIDEQNGQDLPPSLPSCGSESDSNLVVKLQTQEADDYHEAQDDEPVGC